MPSATQPSIIPLGSVGYQTDLATQARSLTHYVIADNIMFEVDGQVRKFGGASKINSVAITSGPAVTGMFDFWFGGGASAFTQKFVVVTGDGKVYKEDMDGTYDDITGAAVITASAIPVFGVAGNLLVIAFNTRNPILKWTGTGNVAALGGSAPLGTGFIYHANRGWIWDGSNLYYSAYENVENWTSSDSGRIPISPGDGDEIRGCGVFKNNLMVFKGPNRGSIHVIGGRSPASFTRDELVSGIPLITHNSIVPVGDDLAFMSPRGCHLMSAVQEFGNYAEADVTRYLKGHFRSKINRTYLSNVWGVNYLEKSCILWATTRAGSAANDQIFGLSYIRLSDEGLKPFTVTRSCTSLAIRKNPTTRYDEVVSGSSNGFVFRQDTTARNVNGAPYTYVLKSPRIMLGINDSAGTPRGDVPVVLEDWYLRSESVGQYAVQAFIERDNNPSELYTFTLGEGASGFLLDDSMLDTTMLGETDAAEIAYSDPTVAGECRTLRFQLTQGGLDQDAKLLELGFNVTPSAPTTQSPIGRRTEL